jgi:hypothetical protein
LSIQSTNVQSTIIEESETIIDVGVESDAESSARVG